MTVSLNIPDAIAPTVVDNICAATNYDAASGKTKAQWVKDQVIAYVTRLSQSGAAKLAIAAAKSQASGNPIT